MTASKILSVGYLPAAKNAIFVINIYITPHIVQLSKSLNVSEKIFVRA